MYEGRKLSEIINTEHENTKYLPDIKLPENIVSSFLIFISVNIRDLHPYSKFGASNYSCKMSYAKVLLNMYNSPFVEEASVTVI